MIRSGWIDEETYRLLKHAGGRPGTWQLDRGPHFQMHQGLNAYLRETYGAMHMTPWGPTDAAWGLHMKRMGSMDAILSDLRKFYEPWTEGLAAFDADAAVLRKGRTKTCPQ